VKYIIISINDDRAWQKDLIRNTLGPDNEIVIDCVNGSDEAQVLEARAEFPEVFENGHPLFYNWAYMMKKGELGVWLSNLRAYRAISEQSEPVIVFEDDAIIRPQFDENMELIMKYLPEEWDLVSLYTPHDCQFPNSPMAYAGIEQNNVVVRNYQSYCFVTIMYTPEGARKILGYTEKYGISGPIDIFVMDLANNVWIDAFATSHQNYLPVNYDWDSPTTIHNTEKY